VPTTSQRIRTRLHRCSWADQARRVGHRARPRAGGPQGPTASPAGGRHDRPADDPPPPGNSCWSTPRPGGCYSRTTWRSG
jgi:hypothetical protein